MANGFDAAEAPRPLFALAHNLRHRSVIGAAAASEDGRGPTPSDWTVMWDGRDGTVSCPLYAARFTVFRTGTSNFGGLRVRGSGLRRLSTLRERLCLAPSREVGYPKLKRSAVSRPQPGRQIFPPGDCRCQSKRTLRGQLAPRRRVVRHRSTRSAACRCRSTYTSRDGRRN